MLSLQAVMHFIRKIGIFAGVLTIFLVSADQASAKRESCAHLAGTYLSSIVDSQGVLLSRAIITLHVDGTIQSIDSNQAGIPGQFNPFSENAGEWICNRPSSIVASAISFALSGSEGAEPQLARNDFRAQVDSRTGDLTGHLELIFFPLTADPYRDAGASAGVFRFTAQRLRMGLR